jgi:hypothetical protein
VRRPVQCSSQPPWPGGQWCRHAARLGLSQQAAAAVGHLFTSSSATSNAVTGLSWVFFILGGIAAATAVQRLYQRVFQLDPRGPRDTLRAVIWLALAVGWTALGTAAAPGFRATSPVLWWIVNIPAFIGFWWFTMWFLLAGRVSEQTRAVRRRRVLGGHAGGLPVIFGMVISYDQIRADHRVAPMSFFIAIGVDHPKSVPEGKTAACPSGRGPETAAGIMTAAPVRRCATSRGPAHPAGRGMVLRATGWIAVLVALYYWLPPTTPPPRRPPSRSSAGRVHRPGAFQARRIGVV